MGVKIYVINLEDRKDRCKHTFDVLTKQLDVDPADIIRINAVDTRKMNVFELQALVENYFSKALGPTTLDAIKRGYRSDHHELTSGSIGCFISQLNALKQIVSNKELGIVVEDDITFGSYHLMGEKMKKLIHHNSLLNERAKDNDILLLGHTGFHQSHPILSSFQNRISPPEFIYPDWFMGLHCYVIKPHSAVKILKLIEIPTKQLDWQLCDLIKEKKIRVKAAVHRYIRVLDIDTDVQKCQPCSKSW